MNKPNLTFIYEDKDIFDLYKYIYDYIYTDNLDKDIPQNIRIENLKKFINPVDIVDYIVNNPEQKYKNEKEFKQTNGELFYKTVEALARLQDQKKYDLLPPPTYPEYFAITIDKNGHRQIINNRESNKQVDTPVVLCDLLCLAQKMVRKVDNVIMHPNRFNRFIQELDPNDPNSSVEITVFDINNLMLQDDNIGNDEDIKNTDGMFYKGHSPLVHNGYGKNDKKSLQEYYEKMADKIIKQFCNKIRKNDGSYKDEYLPIPTTNTWGKQLSIIVNAYKQACIKMFNNDRDKGLEFFNKHILFLQSLNQDLTEKESIKEILKDGCNFVDNNYTNFHNYKLGNNNELQIKKIDTKGKIHHIINAGDTFGPAGFDNIPSQIHGAGYGGLYTFDTIITSADYFEKAGMLGEGKMKPKIFKQGDSFIKIFDDKCFKGSRDIKNLNIKTPNNFMCHSMNEDREIYIKGKEKEIEKDIKNKEQLKDLDNISLYQQMATRKHYMTIPNVDIYNSANDTNTICINIANNAVCIFLDKNNNKIIKIGIGDQYADVLSKNGSKIDIKQDNQIVSYSSNDNMFFLDYDKLQNIKDQDMVNGEEQNMTIFHEVIGRLIEDISNKTNIHNISDDQTIDYNKVSELCAEIHSNPCLNYHNNKKYLYHKADEFKKLLNEKGIGQQNDLNNNQNNHQNNILTNITNSQEIEKTYNNNDKITKKVSEKQVFQKSNNKNSNINLEKNGDKKEIYNYDINNIINTNDEQDINKFDIDVSNIIKENPQLIDIDNTDNSKSNIVDNNEIEQLSIGDDKIKNTIKLLSSEFTFKIKSKEVNLFTFIKNIKDAKNNDKKKFDSYSKILQNRIQDMKNDETNNEKFDIALNILDTYINSIQQETKIDNNYMNNNIIEQNKSESKVEHKDIINTEKNENKIKGEKTKKIIEEKEESKYNDYIQSV